MITLERLKDLDGALKFGNCNSCGVSSIENDSLIRIKASTSGKDFSSLCLCGDCAEKLIEKWEEHFKR